MKHAPTLEQERREILDRIHASRAEYRRRLLTGDSPQRHKTSHHSTTRPVLDNVKDGVKQGLQSATAHPVVTIATVAAIIGVAVLAKRAIDQRTFVSPAERLSNDIINVKDRIAQILKPKYETLKSTRLVQTEPAAPVSAAAKGGALATAGMTLVASVLTMMLRDPMKLKLAGRLFGAAVGYARRQTNQAAAGSRIRPGRG